MRRLFMVLALVVLTLSVTAGALMAAPTKNFKGKASGTSSVPTGGPSVFATTSEGVFIGSHLGKGTFVASGTQTWGAVTADQCDDTVYGIVEGTVTFTKKNGDTLTATAQPGSIVCEVEPMDFTAYESVIIYEITSGTGSFATASGTFTSSSTHTRSLLVVSPFVTESVDVGTWTGVIARQGS